MATFFFFFVVVWLIKSSGIVVFTSLCRKRDCVDKWKVRIRHIALLCGTLDKIPAEKTKKKFKIRTLNTKITKKITLSKTFFALF